MLCNQGCLIPEHYLTLVGATVAALWLTVNVKIDRHSIIIIFLMLYLSKNPSEQDPQFVITLLKKVYSIEYGEISAFFGRLGGDFGFLANLGEICDKTHISLLSFKSRQIGPIHRLVWFLRFSPLGSRCRQCLAHASTSIEKPK